MTIGLGTRLLCYFLGVLAAILIGFSGALYALASRHLYQQADERLEAALNTLAAAAEIGPGGVEWEPEERRLLFGRRTLQGPFAWRITNEKGQRIDGSASSESIDHLLNGLGQSDHQISRGRSLVDSKGSYWRARTLRLEHPTFDRSKPAQGRFNALIFGVIASTDHLRATLRNLGCALAALSILIWLLVLVFGRRLCRIVLRPLTDMADAAHTIGGNSSERRLPTLATNDELEELGRSFNALLDRLGESLERQQRFSGDASHQLRTPLTAIQGHVTLALRQDRTADEYRRVLTLVQSKSRHLCQIVEGLMFLSRADAEARRPALEPVDLVAWFHQFVEHWPHPRQPDLRFKPPESGSFLVPIHSPLLGELVGNLLDNAAKYSSPATPIEVTLTGEPASVSFAVNDRGQGIAPQDLPHLFDPFFRSETVRMSGSTGIGLGLSIAARITEVFLGRISVESNPKEGTTFVVVLPRLPEIPS